MSVPDTDIFAIKATSAEGIATNGKVRPVQGRRKNWE